MVMVKPLSLGFTITLLMAEAVVHRCFSKYVFLKNSFQTCNFIKKRFRYRFFPVKFAKILRTRKKKTPFYGTRPVAASGMIPKPMIRCYSIAT